MSYNSINRSTEHGGYLEESFHAEYETQKRRCDVIAQIQCIQAELRRDELEAIARYQYLMKRANDVILSSNGVQKELHEFRTKRALTSSFEVNQNWATLERRSRSKKPTKLFQKPKFRVSSTLSNSDEEHDVVLTEYTKQNTDRKSSGEKRRKRIMTSTPKMKPNVKDRNSKSATVASRKTSFSCDSDYSVPANGRDSLDCSSEKESQPIENYEEKYSVRNSDNSSDLSKEIHEMSAVDHIVEESKSIEENKTPQNVSCSADEKEISLKNKSNDVVKKPFLLQYGKAKYIERNSSPPKKELVTKSNENQRTNLTQKKELENRRDNNEKDLVIQSEKNIKLDAHKSKESSKDPVNLSEKNSKDNSSQSKKSNKDYVNQSERSNQDYSSQSEKNSKDYISQSQRSNQNYVSQSEISDQDYVNQSEKSNKNNNTGQSEKSNKNNAGQSEKSNKNNAGQSEKSTKNPINQSNNGTRFSQDQKTQKQALPLSSNSDFEQKISDEEDIFGFGDSGVLNMDLLKGKSIGLSPTKSGDSSSSEEDSLEAALRNHLADSKEKKETKAKANPAAVKPVKSASPVQDKSKAPVQDISKGEEVKGNLMYSGRAKKVSVPFNYHSEESEVMSGPEKDSEGDDDFFG